jgi:hypothetical protein
VSAAVDIQGQQFGDLVAIRKAGTNKRRNLMWFCQCACGGTHVALSGHLRAGLIQSCGCTTGRRRGEANATHGHARRDSVTPEYKAWVHLVARCENPNDPSFADYGGRGITVCPEWRHDPAAFLAHVGPRPSARHSIDRIDNSRGYCPGNVRWATKKEQACNRRPRRWARKS